MAVTTLMKMHERTFQLRLMPLEINRENPSIRSYWGDRTKRIIAR